MTCEKTKITVGEVSLLIILGIVLLIPVWILVKRMREAPQYDMSSFLDYPFAKNLVSTST